MQRKTAAMRAIAVAVLFYSGDRRSGFQQVEMAGALIRAIADTIIIGVVEGFDLSGDRAMPGNGCPVLRRRRIVARAKACQTLGGPIRRERRYRHHRPASAGARGGPADRDRARRMLAAALRAEAGAFVAQHAEESARGHDHRQRRDLSAKADVCMWADGVDLQARMEPQAECMRVSSGPYPEAGRSSRAFRSAFA